MISRLAATLALALLATGVARALPSCGKGAIPPNQGVSVNGQSGDQYVVTSTNMVAATPDGGSAVTVGWVYTTRGAGLYFGSNSAAGIPSATAPISNVTAADVQTALRQVIVDAGAQIPASGPLFEALSGNWPLSIVPCSAGGY